MKVAPQREIVIEIERIQLIRKRAKTHLRFCMECGKQSDFVAVAEAASLFGTTEANVFGFIRANGCHHQNHANSSEAEICLVSLLVCMKAKRNGSHIRMIGD